MFLNQKEVRKIRPVKRKIEIVPRKIYLCLFSLACLTFFFCQLAQATRLPPDTRKTVTTTFTDGTVRLDGSIALPDGTLMLPLLPASNWRRAKNDTQVQFPLSGKPPFLIIYENGWGHVHATAKGEALTIQVPAELPEPLRKKLLSMRFPSDLIVPDGLVVPKSCKSLLGDLTIPTMDDASIQKPDFGKPRSASGQAISSYKGSGALAFTSITNGSITLVDGKSFRKLAEFPTEGTPCGLEYVENALYIADQSKNRILILDPSTRKFLGQIDLPARCAPKGLAGIPAGKFIYVANNGTNDVAIIETATGKILVRTKVPVGPGRISVTPDGVYLVVLSVTTGELSVVATYNQKLTGTVKVGSVPTCVITPKQGKIAYVSNRNSNTVSVVDLTKRTLLRTVQVGNGPTGLALSSDEKKLFVANGRDNTIAVYETQTFNKTGEIKLPLDMDFPGCLCLTPDDRHLIVTSQQTGIVGVIDTQKMEITKHIDLGHPVHEVIWLPVN